MGKVVERLVREGPIRIPVTPPAYLDVVILGHPSDISPERIKPMQVVPIHGERGYVYGVCISVRLYEVFAVEGLGLPAGEQVGLPFLGSCPF